jgi:hypothetical protein
MHFECCKVTNVNFKYIQQDILIIKKTKFGRTIGNRSLSESLMIDSLKMFRFEGEMNCWFFNTLETMKINQLHINY